MKFNFNLTTLLEKSHSDLQQVALFKHYFENIVISEIDPNYYLTNSAKGIALVFNRELVSNTLQLFSGNQEDMTRFEGDLPFNCSFEDSIESIHSKIGINDFQSGGGMFLPLLGKTKTWRKYEFENCFVHFEFLDEGGVNMISIESKRVD